MAKESKKAKKERAVQILDAFDREYGMELVCYLHYQTPWQLLFAVILSAQCTDDNVNKVTPGLFRRFPTLEAFRDADVSEIMEAIRSIGLFRNKAHHLKGAATRLLEAYGGELPDSMEELITLPGVGRKTANVILGNIYGKESIVVDTHVKRISRHLGLTEKEDPEAIEYDLQKVLPKDRWILYNIHVIRLGRSICKARRPDCAACFLQALCPKGRSVLNIRE